MIVAVVFTALLFWVALLWVLLSAQGTSPVDFFLGPYEPLPSDLGEWRKLGLDGATGLLCEERLLLSGVNPKSANLVHQVRYRDPQTGVVALVGPETSVRRRRQRRSE
jgi:hypothetical protein